MDNITSQGCDAQARPRHLAPEGRECTDAVQRASASATGTSTLPRCTATRPRSARPSQTHVPRAEIHMTTKVWQENLAPDAMRRAGGSLRELRLDYVDLYLIHWPTPEHGPAGGAGHADPPATRGLARNIGVSNFRSPCCAGPSRKSGRRSSATRSSTTSCWTGEGVAYAAEQASAVTAYCPLAQGRLAEHPALQSHRRETCRHARAGRAEMAAGPGRRGGNTEGRPRGEPAGQPGCAALVLDDDDRAAIAALPKNERIVNPGLAPKWDMAA